MALGIGATTFSLLALSWVISVMSQPFEGKDVPLRRTFFLLFCFALKVPLLGGAWWLTQRLGGPASNHFLYGLFLVYFALVGWAVAKNASP